MKTSPCIGVCELDNAGVCIGCNRTIDEIMEAGRYAPVMGSDGNVWEMRNISEKAKKNMKE